MPELSPFRQQVEAQRSYLLRFAVCKGCRNVNRQMAFLRQAVQRLGESRDNRWRRYRT